MNEPLAAAPVIVVADLEPTDAVLAALRHRYSRDYEIADAGDDPFATLDALSDAGRAVALVLASGDGTLHESAPHESALHESALHEGETVFARTGRLFPDARRALLLDWGTWGDPSSADRVMTLMSSLQIDYYVIRPSASDDEDFHRTVTEFLREWRLESGTRPGFTVIGAESSPRAHVVSALLVRAGFGVVRLGSDSPQAAEILRDAGRTPSAEPIIRTADGRIIDDPDDAALARAHGLTTDLPAHAVDVAIIGAGPSGLAAAVYAASEGLSTLVIERESVGGQASSSSLIRNYLGFPRGVSGAELASRAFQQAWAFGATFAHTRASLALDPTGDAGFDLTIGPGSEHVQARTVVLATGVSYRRLAVPGLRPFVGSSVFYGASSAEAQAQRGRVVCVVGGGNSAGQAALHLARYAASVALLIRGTALAASMSNYLIEQLTARGVSIETGVRVVDAHPDGVGRLATIDLEEVDTGRRRRDCQALFITIGARPHTEWLPDEVLRDRWGYVFTGSSEADEDAPDPWHGRSVPEPLGTSLPGLYAVGDTRRSSLKRVAAAVGEGSVVVSSVHRRLAGL